MKDEMEYLPKWMHSWANDTWATMPAENRTLDALLAARIAEREQETEFEQDWTVSRDSILALQDAIKAGNDKG